MPDNFQKTVDLKEKMQRDFNSRAISRSKRTGQIEHVYKNEGEKREKDELQKINRPTIRKVNEPLFKRIVLVLALILILIIVYFLFLRQKGDSVYLNKSSNWYAVKLVNEEIFYGQIDDIIADPVLIKNVYYDYDQQKDSNETGNLRLVKRGKETYGPDGTMNIIRSQILYMEPLKEDSKVLMAILDYEN